jgi:hypothetical protein
MAMTNTIDMKCGKCHELKPIPKGSWTTMCCHKDIHQTDEEISIEDIQEMGFIGVWETELEAYIEMAKYYLDLFTFERCPEQKKEEDFWDFNFSDIDECLKKIKELTK